MRFCVKLALIDAFCRDLGSSCELREGVFGKNIYHLEPCYLATASTCSDIPEALANRGPNYLCVYNHRI